MGKYTIFIIIFGLIIFLILGLLCLVNNLLLKSQKVKFQFITITKIIKERMLLLEEIKSFIKKNNENEKKYLEDVNKTLLELNIIETSTKENINRIKLSSNILERFIKLHETYSQLNKNKLYNDLVDRISLNEQRLNYAFDIYDKEVTIYNEVKKTKINLFISKIFKITDYEYYRK